MRLSRRLRRASVVTRDVEAVLDGPDAMAKRAANKAIGRALGKLTRGLWRR